jgi:hypothetical protein
VIVSIHKDILRRALDGKVGARALEAMLAANVGQDNLRGQIGHDEFHFDNNAFEAGRAYIQAQRAMVLPALQAGDVASAWAAFGRLSHTAQDFYAHSNYVPLWLSRGHRQLPASEIDPLDPALIASPELRSGRTYYPQEVLYFLPGLRNFALSILPRDSHAHMNLDSAERGPHFEYAYHAAIKRTRHEFEETASLLPPDLFGLFCSLDS